MKTFGGGALGYFSSVIAVFVEQRGAGLRQNVSNEVKRSNVWNDSLPTVDSSLSLHKI
jgi:hypothetical protein